MNKQEFKAGLENLIPEQVRTGGKRNRYMFYTIHEYYLLLAVVLLDEKLGSASPGVWRLVSDNTPDALIRMCKTYGVNSIQDFECLDDSTRKGVKDGLSVACQPLPEEKLEHEGFGSQFKGGKSYGKD